MSTNNSHLISHEHIKMLMRRRDHENRVGVGEDPTFYQESLMMSSIVSWSYDTTSWPKPMVSWCHFPMTESMETLMRCLWESRGLLLLYLLIPPTSLSLIPHLSLSLSL